MEYTLKRNSRSRYVRLRVMPGGEVVVTAPLSSQLPIIERFVASQDEWLRQAIARMAGFRALPSGRRTYLKHKEDARAFLHERIAYWNSFYGFSYGRIAVKNTRRIWGSCSRKGNLNFSYALLLLPRELADYVVVHELCHLKEHNHRPEFWALVAKALPDYRARRRELRRYVPSA